MKQNQNKFELRQYQKSFVKIFLISIMLTLFIFSSCTIHDFGTDPDNDQETIKGSGDLIIEEIEVPYFHSIIMNTAGLVTISQGTEQNVEVTVDENIMEYIIVRVQDDNLVIEIVKDVTLSDYDLTIDVSMTELSALVTNSAGSIKGLNKFEEDVVNLMVNSAGNIVLELDANRLNSMCNSAGNLFLSGQVTDHNVMLSSAGSLIAFELLTDTTTIILNSAGSAQVCASKLLDVTINSVGSVFYKGDPVIIKHINSIGGIYPAY